MDGFAEGAAQGFMSGAVIGGVTGAISNGLQVYNASKSWANTGGKTAYRQMVEHYSKHVIEEGQKLLLKILLIIQNKLLNFLSKIIHLVEF